MGQINSNNSIFVVDANTLPLLQMLYSLSSFFLSSYFISFHRFFARSSSVETVAIDLKL